MTNNIPIPATLLPWGDDWEWARAPHADRAYAKFAANSYAGNRSRIAALEATNAALVAELATEREMREAAEASAAAIPALCGGDFSVPCALHVRAPIEALFKKCAALEAEETK